MINQTLQVALFLLSFLYSLFMISLYAYDYSWIGVFVNALKRLVVTIFSA
jgi:hypothetical protein